MLETVDSSAPEASNSFQVSLPLVLVAVATTGVKGLHPWSLAKVQAGSGLLYIWM